MTRYKIGFAGIAALNIDYEQGLAAGKAAATRDSILAILRLLTPDERSEVANALLHNGEFCWHCGYPEAPGRSRQCWNDE